MAVKLRLTRIGKKKQPQYRIVAADERSPRDGRFLEIVGHYNPLQDPSGLTVDNAKAVKWLSQGAQPTDTVRSLLEKGGLIEKTIRPAETVGKAKQAAAREAAAKEAAAKAAEEKAAAEAAAAAAAAAPEADDTGSES